MAPSGAKLMTSSRQFLRCHDSRDASRGVIFALPAAPGSMIPQEPTLKELALSPVPDDLKSSACLVVRCLNGVSYDLAERKFTAGGWIGGCQEEMPYGEHESHLLLCVEMPVPCRYESSGCAFIIGRGKMKEHEAVCPYRTEKCRCDDVVEGHLMENQRAICPAVGVEYPNSAFGCSSVIPRASLALHEKICQFAQARPYSECQEEESRELKARLAFLEESTEAEMRSLRRRVQELERQNFQQAQRVTELVDQNAGLAAGNAKAIVLQERPEDLGKQIKETVTSGAAAERERGDLPRIPDGPEERVNRPVGGPPALESSDKDNEAFCPRLAELVTQNVELVSQEVELKKQVDFLDASLEGVSSRSSELLAESMSEGTRHNSGKKGGGQDVRENGRGGDRLGRLPDALLNDIYCRLSQEDVLDAMRLSVCSKSLMSAFRSMPTQNFTARSCSKVRSQLDKAVTSVLAKATNVQKLRVGTRALRVTFFNLHHVQHSLQTLVLENTNKAAFALLLRKLTKGPLSARTLHKLTSIKLFEYRPTGTTELLNMLKGLPLLKVLVVASHGALILEDQLIIRHPGLEDLDLRLGCPDADVAILGARALKRICLDFDGRLYLELPECLQSVHFKGPFDSCITGGGRKARAAYLAEIGRSGTIADLSLQICESEAADSGSGVVDPPLPRPAMQSVILNHFDSDPENGTVDAFFADTSCLEVMHLEWWSGSENVPRGPFPRLKELRVPLVDDILDKIASAGNLPVFAKFCIRYQRGEKFCENLESLEALLSAPLLREVVIIDTTDFDMQSSTDCKLPSSLLNWSARIMKRHSKISVSFTEGPGYSACCLCGPDSED